MKETMRDIMLPLIRMGMTTDTGNLFRSERGSMSIIRVRGFDNTVFDPNTVTIFVRVFMEPNSLFQKVHVDLIRNVNGRSDLVTYQIIDKYDAQTHITQITALVGYHLATMAAQTRQRRYAAATVAFMASRRRRVAFHQARG
jgi:hypothetical protein